MRLVFESTQTTFDEFMSTPQGLHQSYYTLHHCKGGVNTGISSFEKNILDFTVPFKYSVFNFHKQVKGHQNSLNIL